jgi:hypothetical protein
MDCDIHCWAEVREAGVWRKVGRIWPADDWGSEGLTDEPYFGREYALFAILAGVRDSWKLSPIAPPRGLPADITTEVKAISEDWEREGHSHSWHSLRHLLEYWAWQESFTEEGVVNGEDYLRIQAGGLPAEWWGRAVSRSHLVPEEVLQRMIEEGLDTAGTFISASWRVRYHEAAEDFVTVTIPRLLALASPEPCVLAWAEQAIAGDKTALIPARLARGTRAARPG